MKILRYAVVAASFIVLVVPGCDDAATNQQAPPIRTAKPTEPAAAASSKAAKDPSGTTERKFDGATFQVPNAWNEAPVKNDFIKVDADFRIAGTAGEARLTLSSAGGGVAENVTRWKGQYQRGPNDPEPRESTLTVDGREATLVELFGTFGDSLRGGEPQKDSAMLGIIIPLSTTNYFIKLTGPRETVLDAKDDVLKLADTARFRD